MRNKFEEWMKKRERKKPNTAYQYAVSIDKISRHYSDSTNKSIDLYKISDQEVLRPICADYALGGRFASFGNSGNGTIRNAIATYLRYIEYENVGSPLSKVNVEQAGYVSEEFVLPADNEVDELNNFTYERDLQNALIGEIASCQYPETSQNLMARALSGMAWKYSAARSPFTVAVPRLSRPTIVR